MKKLVILMIFLFASLICVAPSTDNNEEKRERMIHEYHYLQYEKELHMFIDHLGFRESTNNWMVINDFNCLGEWQFTHSTLINLGYNDITPEEFKKDPNIFPRELQLEALKALITMNEISLNKRITRNDTSRYIDFIGKTINGIPITKGGLLAGMHLGGIGGIKLFIESNGKIDPQDGYNTKLSDYIKEFSIYELQIKR